MRGFGRLGLQYLPGTSTSTAVTLSRHEHLELPAIGEPAAIGERLGILESCNKNSGTRQHRAHDMPFRKQDSNFQGIPNRSG